MAGALLCLLLGSSAATLEDSGWTLHGRVLEKGTRSPLEGISVYALADDTVEPASSDEDGAFEIRFPRSGTYRLGALGSGFELHPPASVNGGPGVDGPDLTLYLQATTELPEVVVRGERNPDRVAKRVIRGETLQRLPGGSGDPVRALQALPGVAVGSDVGGAPAIRGTRPEDNLFYVDNVPVPYLFHADGTVSVIPGDLVDDFNLHAGAFGPEYGDAIGAVVDVSLRPPREDRLGMKLDLSLLGGSAIIEGPVTKNQSFLLAGRRSYLDLVVDRVEDEDPGESFEVPEYFDYQATYLWKVSPRDQLKLDATGAGDRISFRLGEESELVQKEPLLVGQSRAEAAFHRQGLTWDHRFASGTANKLSLGHDRSTSEAILGSAADNRVTFDTVRLREQLRLHAGSSHELLLGADWEHTRADLELDAQAPRCTEFDPECDLTGAERQMLEDRLRVNAVAAYAKDRFRLGEDLHATAGLRYSHDDYLRQGFLEPRLGLEWDVTDATLVTLGWGRHHQFPSGEQVIEAFGNPGLHHIRAEHYTLGLRQGLGHDWVLDLQGYLKQFDDFAIADPERNFVNGADGEAHGLELLLQKLPTERLSGWLAVTASRSERTNRRTGESFPYDYDQPLIVTLVADYRISARWSLGAKWWYHSGTPFTPVVGTGTYPDGRTRPLYGDLNSERLPAFHRLDLRLDRHFVFDTWKLNLYCEVINAYNRRNVSGYTYDPDYTRRDPVYQLPLLPSVGLQAEF